MANSKKKRNDAKEDTEEMLREYWETIESEPKGKEARNDNIKRSTPDEAVDG